MKQPETKKRHRSIIRHYAELICDYVIELQALEQTALKYGVTRGTVRSIVKGDEKYYKLKRAEFSRCPVKLIKNINHDSKTICR
jgi:hypothetical protein